MQNEPETSSFQATTTESRDPQSPNFRMKEGSADKALEVLGDHVFAKRYVVRRKLGQGGFANVYLAYDEKLNRDVAIKRHRRMEKSDIELLRTEAKRVASMNHPNIVSVYDLVDDELDGLLVVMQFIEGQTLSEHLRQRRPNHRFLFQLLEQVCQALSHAHSKDVIHRDIKPSNILIGNNGRTYLSDFGLAFHRSEFLENHVCGTPGYMAPEQIRGETHRIDRRTDLWSLGIVIYEMFVGCSPFPGHSKREILDRTLHTDPLPPRQMAPDLSVELERVIVRTLSKKMMERYPRVEDLLENLVSCPEYQTDGQGTELAGMGPLLPQQYPIGSAHSSSGEIAHLVPKGFRAFDDKDSNIFLQLVPGPRDRFGIPDSIRFWKTWAENTQPHDSTPIGILYGPSGSGKTSFVRAGLVPRIDNSVSVVHVECRPGNLAERVVTAIENACSLSARSMILSQLLNRIRNREPKLSVEGKILLIFDQFESWSHTAGIEERREFADALRHCDGITIQSLIVVRDDFWMGITELMNRLELPLLEGKNCASINLLDCRLAERILEAMGRAYGSLPPSPQSLTSEQQRFLRESIDELKNDDRVICVHLTMFANMMRLQQWGPQLLKQQGGVQGACVRYLHESFESRHAPPHYRRLSLAVVDVLELILPSSHEELRTRSCSRQEIEEVLRINKRERQLEETLRVLSDELRLITPVGEDSEETLDPTNPRYHLAHDFLISPIRQWIEPIRKSTWKGRAIGRLRELSDLWNRRPRKQFYPNLVELIAMRASVRGHSTSEIQRRFLRAATRFHAGRTSIVSLCLIIIVVLVGVAWQQFLEASAANTQRLISKMDLLLHGPASEVPRLMEDLNQDRRLAMDSIRTWSESDDWNVRERLLLLASKKQKEVDKELVQKLDVSSDHLLSEYLGIFETASNGKSLLTEATTEALGKKSLRAAILLFHMGHEDELIRIVSRTSRPSETNMILEECIRWRGNNLAWRSLLSSNKSFDIRRIAAATIGSTPTSQLTVEDQEIFRKMASEKEVAVQGIAKWFLSRHFPDSSSPSLGDQAENSSWIDTTWGGRLLKVESGTAEFQPANVKSNQVTRAEAKQTLWVTQAPITRKQFAEFWRVNPTFDDGSQVGNRFLTAPTEDFREDNRDYPMTNLDRATIFEYCNWRSQQEGLEKCYRFDRLEDIKNPVGQSVTIRHYHLNREATGYRMLHPDEFCYLVSERTHVDKNWEPATWIETSIEGKKLEFNTRRNVWRMFPNKLGFFLHDSQWTYACASDGSIGVNIIFNEGLVSGIPWVPETPQSNQAVLICRKVAE